MIKKRGRMIILPRFFIIVYENKEHIPKITVPI